MTRLEYRIPGVRVIDHWFTVPLEWARLDESEPITIFVRELVSLAHAGDDLPYLAYFEGGPGIRAPRPLAAGWIGRALESYRVLLIDQRGTGKSSRIDGTTIVRRGDAERAASFLRNFRADSIVRDAEFVRARIGEDRPWFTLGSSYGGFITTTYLSHAPHGLAGCMVSGGVPPVFSSSPASDVYRLTYQATAHRNELFYDRFPLVRGVLASIADRLTREPVRLPDGDTLTVRRLQLLGMLLGAGDGFERLYWLFDEAWRDDGTDELSDYFLSQVARWTDFADCPLLTVLQEPIYGTARTGASDWAADRTFDHRFHESARPLFLVGEHIRPWMFDDIRTLRPFRDAAHVLAATREWTPLYDPDLLRRNDVPVASVLYVDDIFVPFEVAWPTAEQIGNSSLWITNEYQHDGLAASTDVFTRLQSMLQGRS